MNEHFGNLVECGGVPYHMGLLSLQMNLSMSDKFRIYKYKKRGMNVLVGSSQKLQIKKYQTNIPRVKFLNSEYCEFQIETEDTSM